MGRATRDMPTVEARQDPLGCKSGGGKPDLTAGMSYVYYSILS